MEAYSVLIQLDTAAFIQECCLLPSTSNNQQPLFKVHNIWHVKEHSTNLEFPSLPLYRSHNIVLLVQVDPLVSCTLVDLVFCQVRSSSVLSHPQMATACQLLHKFKNIKLYTYHYVPSKLLHSKMYMPVFRIC